MGTGVYHTCALLVGGGSACWGWNSNGQLGTGDTTDRHTSSAVTGLGAGGQSRCKKHMILLLVYLVGSVQLFKNMFKVYF